ncbi:hypothetical protein JG688_00018650 [Phytophthora aleatoria]|uniref:Uncharacterized protein n=1 Tax=Phytophthora aleatoria TaxID=2496075 RepID=A0A8J5IBL8_9STRA|nr:hypothetical protein JG688_00018650 [Phytophthora aleatoria]
MEEVLENTTAEKTKYIYIRAIARFVEWLYANTEEDRRQSLFTSAFRELETTNGESIAV